MLLGYFDEFFWGNGMGVNSGHQMNFPWIFSHRPRMGGLEGFLVENYNGEALGCPDGVFHLFVRKFLLVKQMGPLLVNMRIGDLVYMEDRRMLRYDGIKVAGSCTHRCLCSRMISVVECRS